MKRFLIAFVLLLSTNAFGEEITGRAIGRYIKELSSPHFAGRLSGSPGGREVGEYIAGAFKDRGLMPAVDGSYFQPFEISLKSLGKDNRLSVSGKELKIVEDYVPLTVCPPGEVRGKNAPPADRRGFQTPSEGFSDKDVIGKIAVVRYDEPAGESGLAAKIKEAEENGDRALVILKQDLYSDYTVWKELIPPKLHTRWEKFLKENFPHFLQMKVTQKMNLTPPVTARIPCLMVREDIMSPLFMDETPMSFRYTNGHENVIAKRPEADEAISEPGHEIASTDSAGLAKTGNLSARNDNAEGFSGEMILKVDITEDKIPARNIIGYLPGKGEHKDEVIIIGAHYDHLGLDSKGVPFPGADDNASGVAALLEVAERLAKKGTERSVVFIAFDGEEWGLTGSKYYTGHPVFPLNKTFLMVNMDAIGRNEPDAIHFLGSQRSPDVRRVAGEIAERTGIKTSSLPSNTAVTITHSMKRVSLR
ncbi:MAG: M20/M25/M40 family metallo-hydrolase [Nitrospirae bacterium]|nr:M20/M25/M40 family metallo-hydrolase [Nitrospirota bacterium]